MSRRYWFQYIGPAGGEFTPGNYILLTPVSPVVACPGGSNLCAIYTTGGSIPYSVTINIKNYIALAKSRKHSFPDGLNEKPYVYVQGDI